MRFRRPRHKHTPKLRRNLDNTKLDWVEECECGKRRIARLGYGTESGIYYSRWFDIEEIEKYKLCFPELFDKEDD